ncbi:MAG: endonuclease NucS [Immundisolibacterales bacterium]|nr:endonuclease NucS [Immundisolibacterales bacterium]
MTDDFGIWELDETTKGVRRLEESARAETEALLEDVFVRNPSLLMPGLELVGRQLRTSNGNLDLLGVDSEGRLVVFELKRGTLTREAVAQAVDYASWLDSLVDADLSTRIAENSGQHGIDDIENFEAWYDDHDNWDSLESLRPVRIVLVGLGADASARRMADWLAAKGADIDLLTFLGFRYGDRMLLARQLESGDEARKQEKQEQNASRRALNRAIRGDAIDVKIHEYGMRDWWLDAISVLEWNSKPSYRAKLGITFYKHRKRTLSTGARAAGSHKIEIVERGVARVIFFPAAVELCLNEFERLRQEVPFDLEAPGNAPVTEQVSEQWCCRLDESRWQEHRERIAELVRMVDERWRQVAE